MKFFIAILLFLIPLVWSRQVNANYLTVKTFFLYFAAALALVTVPSLFVWRQIPKKIYVLLAGLFLYQMGYYFLGQDFERAHFFQMFKLLSFAALTFFFYSYRVTLTDFFKKATWPFLIMWSFIVILTGVEIFKLRFEILNFKTDAILSTFGNVNMFSEFVILAFPLVFVWTRIKDQIPRFIKLALLFSLTFLILYCRSRSAWMGLALWIMFQAYQGFKKEEWAALAGAFALFGLAHLTTPNIEAINKFQPQYFSERASLYKGSVELLLDNPTGIPIGQFMNRIVPYLIDKPAPPNEFSYFDQPHSEFLKWGIQFGWAFLFLVLVFLAFLCFELFKKYKKDESDQKTESVFLISSFLVLLPQMTFQFPFENPASIMVLAFVLAIFLCSYQQVKTFNIQMLYPILGVYTVVGLFNAFFFLGSVYLESHYPNSPDVMNIVCRIYPTNFKACFYKNRSLLQLKNLPAFQSEFKKDYPKNMFYCDNLRLLPEFANYSQSAQKTCEALLIYKEIYKQQKHFLPEVFQSCSAVSLPFKYENGQQFTRDFQNWLKNL